VTHPDADFVALHKAIYGESVDVREAWEIAKLATDAPDMHVDQPTQRKQAKAKNPNAGKEGLAAGLLLGVPAESMAAAKQIRETATKLKEPMAAPATGHLFNRVRGFKGGKPAAVGEAALQTANLGVGLLAARELLKKPKQQPVAKAGRIQLRAVNAAQVQARVPSLRARRPPGSPGPMGKSFDAKVTIAKVNPYKQQVFGWAQVAAWDGQEVHDRQGDVVSIDELEKAAYDYVLDCRMGGDQHGRVTKADGPRQTATMIESMVFTPEKIEAMGLPSNFPQAWWTGFQVHDPQAWDDVITKRRTGFSVHGTGRRELVSKVDLNAAARFARKASRKVSGRITAQPVGESPRSVVVRRGKFAVSPSGEARWQPVTKADLKERVQAAVHPPPVARHEVQSTAVKSMGYQPQTHRLAYEMHSRPDQPYNYKASKEQAYAAQHAPSIGHQYATQVRGRYKRKERILNPMDRARLFVNPPPQQVSKDVDPSVQRRRKVAGTTETAASLTAGTVGAGFAGAQARKQFQEEHPARYRQVSSAVGRFGAKGPKRAWMAGKVLTGKPNLAAFGALLAAGGVAGAAHRYQQASKLNELYQGSDLQQRVRHPRRRRAKAAVQPVSKDNTLLTPQQVSRRQKRASIYSKVGATLGLAALGSKAGAAGVRRFATDAEKGANIADQLERHTSTVLAGGAGLSAISGFNSARLSRNSALQEQQQQKVGGIR